MKAKAILASIAAAMLVAATPVQAEKPATDMLSKMFIWWDQAFKTPGAYTAENFGKFFTPDATLTLNGETVATGLDQWASHFQKIQASGALVEIVVPFKEVFEKDGTIYSYHVIRSRREGKAGCMLAAGHATLRDGKIASVTLVRAAMDPAKGPIDPECWTN
jgi:hypothetical protein